MIQSEFREDIVSGDWVLVAKGLKKKPNFFSKSKRSKSDKSIKNCPFENPQKSNKVNPIFWIARASHKKLKLSSWFLQVVPNKFPVLAPHHICPMPLAEGSHRKMSGVGFQELVITRDHKRSLGFMAKEEIRLVLEAYLVRYQELKKEKCTEYILIFHNNGLSAGATVPHPHSQILALPIIPLDVSRSLEGSARYFREKGRCVHCVIVKNELRAKKRVIYKNENFVLISPYASHVSFEARIYPLKHRPHFENIDERELQSLADIMRVTFVKFRSGLNNPDYNFFIHTTPPKNHYQKRYHWHVEIFPRTNIWGGLELGTGTEVVKVPPEEAARILKKAKT